MAAAEVVVYLTPWCGYCRAAEALLQKKRVDYNRIDVSGDVETRQWLRERTGQRTVPQIFINNESIGGFSELSALERSGQLDAKLDQPPA